MKRFFLGMLVAVVCVHGGEAKPGSPMIEAVHEDLWKRFVQSNGLLLDYTTLDGAVELPTAEECREGKPNAISWWTPIENGAFFTGIYLEAAVRRWQSTRSPADREKAHKLADGLMLTASVSDVPGFIARGVLPDGKSHYPIGSDDQTGPWFQGLWAYVNSGAATPEEKKRIEAKMVEVAEVLRGNGWHMPCAASGNFRAGQVRGSFGEADYRSACRKLFVTRVMFEITKDAAWGDAYENALNTPTVTGKTLLRHVEDGIPGWWLDHPDLISNQIWLCVNPQAMVRELANLERRPEVREKYLGSLRVSAQAVAHLIVDAPPVNFESVPHRTDWRSLNARWRPQATAGEAVSLALEQLRGWRNQGRDVEITRLREPLAAAAILRLAPRGDARTQAASARFEHFIQGVSWTKLHGSYGLFAEFAWFAGR